MKIVEIKGSIAADGSILLPPSVLESMGVDIGDTVHLAYLSHHPVKQLNEKWVNESGDAPAQSPEMKL